jgi:glycosyltransferase involved in cell wall biosynthesis
MVNPFNRLEQNMISVVIPTYKEPEALDLCLKSAIEGQKNQNQIIVVVDGFYDLNEDVLKKYASHLDILNLDENVGMIKAMNLGHYNAIHDLVFHVQDDNVFPTNWDKYLLEAYQPHSVLTPNQMARWAKANANYNDVTEIVTLDECTAAEKNKATGTKTWIFKI